MAFYALRSVARGVACGGRRGSGLYFIPLAALAHGRRRVRTFVRLAIRALGMVLIISGRSGKFAAGDEGRGQGAMVPGRAEDVGIVDGA